MMKTLPQILSCLFLLFSFTSVSCKETQAVSSPNLIAFATGLTSPVCITNAGDSRLFVVNQQGKINIVNSDGTVNPVPFLDITSRVKYGGEEGLLGVAFHPQYKMNGYFYVNYIGTGDSTHISRFNVSSTNPDQADPSSEFKLMTIFQPFTNHKGGNLSFGADGYLYIGLGDGGSEGDPNNRAQNLMDYHGKILRIDVNHGNPYAIPTSNPFFNSTTALREIWAYGLRNPWRFSFDPLTHDLWIGDVGQNTYEEIDLQPSTSIEGENYGWRCYEGNASYNTVGCNASPSYTFPVYTYPHASECAVIGGFVNRSNILSPLYGYYFFADYCSDRIWTLHNESGNWVVNDIGRFLGNNFSTFGMDVNGQLYIAGLTSGTLYQINEALLGINTTRAAVNVKVLSLPGYGKFSIETNRNDNSPMRLALYNIYGESCYNSSTNDSHVVMDISFLPRGIYILNVVLNGKNSFHKLINGL